VPPQITSLTGLPANGTTTDEPVQSFSITFSEAMKPDTVNAANRMVWSYGGHFYTLTQSSTIWDTAEPRPWLWAPPGDCKRRRRE